MDTYESMMLENFKLYFPLQYKQMVYHEPIGFNCLEIKLMTDEVVIYDDFNKSIRGLPCDGGAMSEEEVRREFGYRLRRIMEHKHITQIDLSERTGIAQCYISGYVNGRHTPSLYIMGKLARALRCDINDFIYR